MGMHDLLQTGLLQTLQRETHKHTEQMKDNLTTVLATWARKQWEEKTEYSGVSEKHMRPSIGHAAH